MERLYSDLASWWPLLSPTDTYSDEGPLYFGWLAHILGRTPTTLLELGSGGGHLACHYPQECEVTLLDISESMLEVSRTLNTNKIHVCEDMRTARLGRVFDAVLIHDAIMYMTSRTDVVAALRTARAHLNPGGALLVLPDVIQESFMERTLVGGQTEGERAIQVMEWHWDPDVSDESFVVEFSYLLREGNAVRNIHEQHEMGLFPFMTWLEMFDEAGFDVVTRGPEHMMDLGGEVFWARARD